MESGVPLNVSRGVAKWISGRGRFPWDYEGILNDRLGPSGNVGLEHGDGVLTAQAFDEPHEFAEAGRMRVTLEISHPFLLWR